MTRKEMEKIRVHKDDIAVVSLQQTQSGKWSLSWSNAPYALVFYDTSGRVMPDAGAVWGLDRRMSVDEALREFEHIDMYKII